MRALLLFLLLAAPATAQRRPAQQPQPAPAQDRGPQLGRQGPSVVAEPAALALAGFDADQDGVVTRAEAATGAQRSFALVAGSAQDFGYIGYSQWAARWLGDPNTVPGPFEVDIDRNDRITAAEIATTLLGAFDRYDRNHDGKLTRAELVTVRATAFGDDRGAGGRSAHR